MRLHGVRRGRAVLVAPVIFLAVAAWAATHGPGDGASRSNAAGQTVSMTTVSPSELAAEGITLSPASGGSSISAQQAESAVPGTSQPLEAVLADVTDSGGGLHGRLMWVVSVGPQGTFALPSGATAWWKVFYVDPQTGVWTQAATGPK